MCGKKKVNNNNNAEGLIFSDSNSNGSTRTWMEKEQNEMKLTCLVIR